MPLQSVVFLSPKWNLTSARQKFKSMGHKLLKGKKVDIVKTYQGKILQYRFRVLQPKFKRYATKKLPNGVILILGFI